MKRAFIIFLKYPEKGKVKTRLSEIIGEQLTLEIYIRFIEDLFLKAKSIASNDVYVFYSYSDKINKNSFFFSESFLYKEQSGFDLGLKMYNSFKYVFKQNYEQAVLIGSDSPDMPDKLINDAYSILAENDLVLGPSFDGGYYLIGLNKRSLHKDLFVNIKWSTDSVLSDTLNIANKLNLNHCLLDKWFDVDTVDDLIHFKKRNAAKVQLKTIKFLSDKKIY